DRLFCATLGNITLTLIINLILDVLINFGYITILTQGLQVFQQTHQFFLKIFQRSF
ncbi:unnamed protein product, partial [marine sediment metagenome]